MPNIKVQYTITLEQTVFWPDDEMDNLNYSSLVCNLEPEESAEIGDREITETSKDGINFDF